MLLLDVERHRNKINDVAINYKISPRLLACVAMTESKFNEFSCRFESEFSHFNNAEEVYKMLRPYDCSKRTVYNMYATSYGLCHIMGATYYDMGGKNFATELVNPDINLDFACRILQRIKERYEDVANIYTVYNGGSIRYKTDGVLVNGDQVRNFMINYHSKIISSFALS